MQVDSIIERIIQDGRLHEHELKGCTADEVEEIRRDQDVPFLPAEYRRYLQRMGRGAGSVLRGSDAFYPDILELKPEAQTLLIDCGVTHVDWGPDSLLVAMHQGYQMFWSPTVRDPACPVFMYQEGDPGISMTWDNFPAYLEDMLLYE